MPRSKFAKYTCDICQKTLRRKQTFEAHMKTHFPQEEKQFKCDGCDKSFGSQAWLTRHGVHSAEGEGQLERVESDPETGHFSGTSQDQKQFGVRKYETWETDPFIIFPREIWCMILDNIGYFNDLQNIFEVYPELEVLHRRRKQLYLFDQVLPHIAEWMGERDLLNCRRVSRQWNMGVDNFLENHPSRRAYNPDPDADQHATGQMWDPISYSKCFHGQSFKQSHVGHSLYREFFSEAYSFYGGKLGKFLLKMEGHPEEINPFVGRSATFHIGTIYDFSTLDDSLKKLLIFMDKWGKHIWFIKFVPNSYISDRRFTILLQKCIRYLPNLRAVHIDMQWKQLKSKDFQKNLPVLPYLETLQITDGTLDTPLFGQLLLPQYSTMLRRVQLPLPSCTTRLGFPMPLPNLTELIITHITVFDDWAWKQGVGHILLSLEAPQLYRLGLQGSPSCIWQVDSAYWNDSEIFIWLQRFPGLKHFYLPFPNIGTELNMQCADAPFKGTACNHGNFISTSIESICLHIETLTTSPHMLYHFPSIQSLQICADLPLGGVASNSRDEAKKFRTRLDALHLERLWEVLKALKKLNVITIMYSQNFSGPRYRLSKQQLENYLLKKGAI